MITVTTILTISYLEFSFLLVYGFSGFFLYVCNCNNPLLCSNVHTFLLKELNVTEVGIVYLICPSNNIKTTL